MLPNVSTWLWSRKTKQNKETALMLFWYGAELKSILMECKHGTIWKQFQVPNRVSDNNGMFLGHVNIFILNGTGGCKTFQFSSVIRIFFIASGTWMVGFIIARYYL